MQPPPPQCPRCAYDLSGTVASWADACPLTGTCSECGLLFHWQEVLDPDIAGPAWSFEHGHHRSLLSRLRRYLATLARVLTPARAWRDLTLATVIHPARLALFVPFTLALMHVLDAVTIALSRLASPTLAGVLVYQWPGLLLWPYGEGRLFSPLDGMPFGTPLLIITFTMTLAMPLGLLLLGETFRRHSVRAAHLLRGACYSVPVAALWILATTAFKHILRHSPLNGWIESLTRSAAAMPALAALYALLLAFWWHTFIDRYLRVTSAATITIVMIALAYLATMTILIALAVLARVV